MDNYVDFQKFSELITLLEVTLDNLQNNQQELMTSKEVMRFLKISRNSYNRLKDEGMIKVYSLRGKLYCKRSEIMQTIENCRVN